MSDLATKVDKVGREHILPCWSPPPVGGPDDLSGYDNSTTLSTSVASDIPHTVNLINLIFSGYKLSYVVA